MKKVVTLEHEEAGAAQKRAYDKNAGTGSWIPH